MNTLTPLQKAQKESGDMAPTKLTRSHLAVALAYARKQVTLKGVSVALDVSITQAYNRVFRVIATAVREGWLVEKKD